MNILPDFASHGFNPKQYAAPLLTKQRGARPSRSHPSASRRRNPVALFFTLASACLLALVSPQDSLAQCVAIPQWQYASTNLTRCGTNGHLTNDTYYGAENVTWSSTSSLPNAGTATYSGDWDTAWPG